MSEVQIAPEVARQLAEGIGGTLPKNASSVVKEAFEAFRNGQAERALDIVALKRPAFSPDDVRQTLIENLGVRDPKTGEKKEPTKKGSEKDRFDKTKETAEKIREYLDNPQAGIPQELIDMVTSCLKGIPAYKDLIYDQSGKINSSITEQIATTLLRDPEVRRRIIGLYNERIDPAKRLGKEKEVLQLEKEIERIKAELESYQNLDQQIEQKRQEIDRQRASIQQMPQYRTYSSLLQTLDRLNGEKADSKARLNELIESRPKVGKVKKLKH